MDDGRSDYQRKNDRIKMSKSYDEYLISLNEDILAALKLLDKQPRKDKVLFIEDKDKRIVGSLTDGDIRRALIGGAAVNDKVATHM